MVRRIEENRDEYPHWISAFWVPALLVTHAITFVVLVKCWPAQTRSPSSHPQEAVMQIKFASIMVEDQDKALQFYTQMLGFTRRPTFRWASTVSSLSPRPRVWKALS
jgi:hypothetical protein